MLQAAGRALGVAGDDYAPTGAIGRRYMLRHLIEQIDTLPGPGLGKTLVAAAMEVDRVGGQRRGVEAGEGGDSVPIEVVIPVLWAEVEQLRRDGLVVRGTAHPALAPGFAAGVVVVGDQLMPGLECLGDLVIRRHRRVGTIIEQRLHALVKQRQPVFHADMALTGRHGFVQHVVAAHVAEQFAITASKPRDSLGCERHFTDWQQHDFVARAGRALAHGIERTDLLQGVAEQVEAKRLGNARREEIDQAAADGEFARLHHGFGTAVAVFAEKPGKPRHIHCLALAQDHCGVGVEAARRHLLKGSPH